MTRRNWDKVAERQFRALDEQAQADWGELRKRTLD